MDRIISASSSTVKGLVLLRQKAVRRRQSRSFLIEGERLVLDAPEQFIKELYVTEDALTRRKEDLKSRGLLQQPLYSMDEVTGRESLGNRQAQKPLLLLLEDIQDPGNLGTMLRTAEAAGVTGIIMSRGTVDVFNPKVVRSTMSAIFRQPFIYVEDLTGTVRMLQERSIRVYAACLEESTAYHRADYTGACAVAVGNEANGLSEELIRQADQRIRIPMAGSIESLNAAISAGILLYEAARQRNFA